jgi:hypothetical protein
MRESNDTFGVRRSDRSRYGAEVELVSRAAAVALIVKYAAVALVRRALVGSPKGAEACY